MRKQEPDNDGKVLLQKRMCGLIEYNMCERIGTWITDPFSYLPSVAIALITFTVTSFALREQGRIAKYSLWVHSS